MSRFQWKYEFFVYFLLYLLMEWEWYCSKKTNIEESAQYLISWPWYQDEFLSITLQVLVLLLIILFYDYSHVKWEKQ